MLNLIERTCSYCLRNGYISEDKVPWLRYSLEKRLTVFCVAIPFWLMGVCLSSVQTSTSFVLSFYFLRERVNGYHAKSLWVCFFVSMMSELLFLGFLPKLVDEKTALVLMVIAATYIFTNAPAKCPQMMLTDGEMKASAIGSRVRTGLIVLAECVFNYFDRHQVTAGIRFGIMMAACGLAAAQITYKGEYT